jgi:long-chain acyl-CoA synthetase
LQNEREFLGIVSGERFSDHATLARSYGQATNLLKEIGVKSSDAVAILMRNDIAFVVATRAIVNAGAYPVPINWHGTPESYSFILTDSGAKVLIAHADLAATLGGLLPPDCRLIVVETPPELAIAFKLPAQTCRIPKGALDWDRLLADQPSQADPPPYARAAIMYTSGTTGRPKGVRRAPVKANVEQPAARILREVFGVSANEAVRALIPGPIYHAAPNFWSVRASEPGSLAVLQPRFDEEQFLQLIERFGITHTFLVPTMMIRLLRLPATVRNKYDLSSLRRVVHSAAPISKSTKYEFIKWLGPKIVEFYGGTENGVVTIADSQEWLKHPGTVGRRLDNCRISITDEKGNELGANQVGEIFAYNFNLPPFEYVNLPGVREKSERDALFSIGDVGYLNSDGYLFLCDRKKDMIITGGVNVYPIEIENALQSMPEVRDSAVFGIPHPEYGEEICAHILPETGISLAPEHVTAWLEKRLPRYMLPRKVVIVDHLPREASGKIMKRKVRDQYWGEQGRMI